MCDLSNEKSRKKISLLNYVKRKNIFFSLFRWNKIKSHFHSQNHIIFRNKLNLTNRMRSMWLQWPRGTCCRLITAPYLLLSAGSKQLYPAAAEGGWLSEPTCFGRRHQVLRGAQLCLTTLLRVTFDSVVAVCREGKQCGKRHMLQTGGSKHLVRKQDDGHTGPNIKPASIQSLYLVPACLQVGYWLEHITGHFHQHIFKQGGVPSLLWNLKQQVCIGTSLPPNQITTALSPWENGGGNIPTNVATTSNSIQFSAQQKKHFCVFKTRCSFRIQSWWLMATSRPQWNKRGISTFLGPPPLIKWRVSVFFLTYNRK